MTLHHDKRTNKQQRNFFSCDFGKKFAKKLFFGVVPGSKPGASRKMS